MHPMHDDQRGLVLADLIDGEPEITSGEVLVAITA